MLQPTAACYRALFGAIKQGAVAVPMFTAPGPDGIRLRTEDCTPKRLFTCAKKAGDATSPGGPVVHIVDDAFLHSLTALPATFRPDTSGRDLAVLQYTSGTTRALMPASDGATAPSFLAAALKDACSGNLDRIQILKGWVDADGDMHEKICDVVRAGDREPGPDGKVRLIGSTVDVKKASCTNTIGAPELIAVWADPDFDPAEKAFYYARAIEFPASRWTACDAAYFEDPDFADDGDRAG